MARSRVLHEVEGHGSLGLLGVCAWAETSDSLSPPSVPDLRVLRHVVEQLGSADDEVDLLRTEVEMLRDELGELRARLDQVESLALSSVPLSEDDATRWLERNPDAVLDYKGQQIAVHGERGIVAYAADLDGLREQVRALGLEGQVLFSSVPDFL